MEARQVRGATEAADRAGGTWSNSGDLAATLNSGGNDGGFRTEPGEHLAVFVKRGRAQSDEDDESWGEGDVMPTPNAFDVVGDVRTTAAIIGGDPQDDPLLPLGLDSSRYRCCGNGVVAPVAEWLGYRLLEALP
jgi:site-specific DNA-cytosine methylase